MPAIDPTRYPKCKYHASEPAVLVASPDEEKDLGPGWFDHPNEVKTLPPQSDTYRRFTEVPKASEPDEEPKPKPAKVKPSAVTSGDAA